MANSAYFKKALTGGESIWAVLRGLPEALQTTILADGVEAAAKPVERAARRLVTVRTGALRQSINHKVVRGKGKAFAMALIGPDRGSYRAGKRVQKGSDSRGADKPANYAHLVEFGHITVKGGKGEKGKTLRKKTATATGFVPAKPFMRPAIVQAEAECSVALLDGIARGIDKARDRLTA